MAEEKFYNGYYCDKCKLIPLIQIVPKKESLFILSLCHCNKNYQEFDIFHNNFYTNKIPINNIRNQALINNDKEIKEDDIKSVETNFQDIKKKILEFSKGILDNLKNYVKEKDPDNLKTTFEKYVDINNKIISIIENFFNSYELIKDNLSIKLNISNIFFNKDFTKKDKKYLLTSSPDIYYKNSIIFFQEEYVISQQSMKEQLQHKCFKSQNINNSVLCLIEIEKNIFALNVKDNPNIFLYKIEANNNNLSFSFKAHHEKVNWIMKTNENYLISCGIDFDIKGDCNYRSIKIWPIFNENIFKEEKLNITPYEFNLDREDEDDADIQKMIYINKDLFLAFSKKYIYLFNFIPDQKEKIELTKTSEIMDIIDLIYVKNVKTESRIVSYNKDRLYLINNNLQIIQRQKLKNIEEKNCLLQLNNNSIMIAQRDGNLLVLNIVLKKVLNTDTVIEKDEEELSIILKIKIGSPTDYLYKLKDGTIIQSGSKGMRRIMIKNMLELPILYTPFNDTEFDHPYKTYEKITCLNELSDGRIIKCVVIGTIYLCEFIFI